MKLFQYITVTTSMESNLPLTRAVLHEDLQILRYTLAAILDDVRMFSPLSASAVERAIHDLDRARRSLDGGDEKQPLIDRFSNPSPVRDDHMERHVNSVLSPASISR